MAAVWGYLGRAHPLRQIVATSYTTTPANPNLNRLIPARGGACEDFSAEKYKTRVG